MPAFRSSIPARSWRHRLPRYHLPLALASVLVLVLLMTLPAFDARANHEAVDISSGALPQRQDDRGSMAHTGSMDHGNGQARTMDHGGGQSRPVGTRSFTQRLTAATGYVALSLLGITLLIGPINLLLRRRNPISSYLRRDTGLWTVIFSIVHVIAGLQVHGSLSAFGNYFLAPGGGPLLSSFGLGNWTGLGATIIAVGLLVISNDGALRKLKARPWKRIQRLNYVVFALVVLHAFFYGALSRTTSPVTLLLIVTTIAVLLGQAVGIWLWRRRHANV